MSGLMQIPEFAGFMVGLVVGTIAGFAGGATAVLAAHAFL